MGRPMPPPKKSPTAKSFAALVTSEPTKQDQVIAELQEELTRERDGRREDRFVGIVLIALLLDVVFFTVVPGWGVLGLILLELLILIPLARRMGMEEIAQIINSLVSRLAGKGDKTGD